MKKIHVSVSNKSLSIEKAFEFIQCDSHGAVSSFVGKVRDFNLGKKVIGVSYDVFVPFAIHIFQKICEEVHNKWGQDLKIFIEHFCGRLDVGGMSVLIVVSSPHRDEAFQACRYIIETIKHRAPIWKQEHYTDGNSEWVKGHSLCL